MKSKEHNLKTIKKRRINNVPKEKSLNHSNKTSKCLKLTVNKKSKQTTSNKNINQTKRYTKRNQQFTNTDYRKRDYKKGPASTNKQDK